MTRWDVAGVGKIQSQRWPFSQSSKVQALDTHGYIFGENDKRNFTDAINIVDTRKALCHTISRLTQSNLLSKRLYTE